MSTGMLDREIRLMMTRRLLLGRGTIGLAAICFAPWWAALAPAAEVFEVTHSDADWRKLLTPDQYAVLRQNDTERRMSDDFPAFVYPTSATRS